MSSQFSADSADFCELTGALWVSSQKGPHSGLICELDREERRDPDGRYAGGHGSVTSCVFRVLLRASVRLPHRPIRRLVT